MEPYLGVQDKTRHGSGRSIWIYIQTLLGDLAIGRIDGKTPDAFYAEQRRCRARLLLGTGPLGVETVPSRAPSAGVGSAPIRFARWRLPVDLQPTRNRRHLRRPRGSSEQRSRPADDL